METQLLNPLSNTSAPMIGHSFGGWLSMNFALRGILGGMAGNEPVIYSMIKWLPLHQSVF